MVKYKSENLETIMESFNLVKDKPGGLVIKLPAASEENLGVQYTITTDDCKEGITIEKAISHEPIPFPIKDDDSECCYNYRDYWNYGHLIAARCLTCKIATNTTLDASLGWNYCPNCGRTITSKKIT